MTTGPEVLPAQAWNTAKLLIKNFLQQELNSAFGLTRVEPETAQSAVTHGHRKNNETVSTSIGILFR